MKRVVITGMSLVSSLGNTPNDAFERLHTYENCVDYQSDLDQYEKLTTRLAARVKNFTKPEIKKGIIEANNFTVPFDFDGDRYLFLFRFRHLRHNLYMYLNFAFLQ